MLKIELNAPNSTLANHADQQASLQEYQYLAFEIAGQKYAGHITHIREVRTVQKLKFVPGLPTYVVGVTSFRGEIVAVIDLRRRFGLPDKEQQSNLIVVVECESKPIAFRVDRILDIWQIKVGQIQSLPDKAFPISNQYLDGAIDLSPGLAVLLNLQKLLSHEELHQINDTVPA